MLLEAKLKLISSITKIDYDFIKRNSNFYELFFSIDKPQPEYISNSKIPVPEGTIYSHTDKCYLAPHDGIPIFNKANIVSNIVIDKRKEWHSYIDARINRPKIHRLNIGAHGNKGVITIHGKLRNADYFKLIAAPNPYDDTPISEIRLLSCFSATGGGDSLAAEVSNITGLPTTGYRGKVMRFPYKYLSEIRKNGGLEKEKFGGFVLEPLNFQHVSMSKPPIPSALSREFNPTFGSPGFDDMSSFLGGVFVI